MDHVQRKNSELSHFKDAAEIDPVETAAEFAEYSRLLAPYITDTSTLLHQALNDDQVVLAEGAQGTLLDLDHGTYPFVTSSWPTAGGALVGLGVGPKAVRRIVGVAKAFTTRVGEGPFPTEIDGDIAIKLRGTGELPWDEFGTTTGRPRRVGWLDLVILRYAVSINSLTELALTKLDILSGFKEVLVCVGYLLDGQKISDFPPDIGRLTKCQPVYEVLPGWSEDIMDARNMSDLPVNARSYINYIEQAVGLPIVYVSVGPGREQVIRKRVG
jgi:adenylosuccinate synthase